MKHNHNVVKFTSNTSVCILSKYHFIVVSPWPRILRCVRTLGLPFLYLLHHTLPATSHFTCYITLYLLHHTLPATWSDCYSGLHTWSCQALRIAAELWYYTHVVSGGGRGVQASFDLLIQVNIGRYWWINTTRHGCWSHQSVHHLQWI